MSARVEQSRAETAYAEAIDTAQHAGDVVGVATAALGLAGGADESVGFNLTGLDRVLLAMLNDARTRLPDSQLPLRSLVTTKVTGARYDAGEIDVAQQLSVDALARVRVERPGSDRRAAVAMRHTARSRRRSISANAKPSTTSSEPSIPHCRCRPRSGASATCWSAATSRLPTPKCSR